MPTKRKSKSKPKSKAASKRKPKLTFEQVELSVLFTDGAFDNPRMTFDEVAKKILPQGFGEGQSGKAFRNESERIFDLERDK
jgi:hypothetical protein